MSIPLVFATAAFLGVLLWRVRPLIKGSTRLRPPRQELLEARARIEAAPDEPSRALALCDAADLVVKTVSRGASATGFYLRAIRSDPRSAEIIRRAAAGLAARPRVLESLLWRRLAIAPWTGPSRDSAEAALDALRTLYEGPLKNAVRARALANARDALGE